MSRLAWVAPLGLATSLLVPLSCTTGRPAGPSLLDTPIPGISAPPFTAAELRAGSPAGRMLDFRVEARGQPPVHRVVTFVAVDDEHATLETHLFDDAGRELTAPSRLEQSWEELQRQAQFASEQLAVSSGVAHTPAGDFPCHVYTVRATGAVHTFWFADTLPGPPVLFHSDDGRGRLMTSTLVRHTKSS